MDSQIKNGWDHYKGLYNIMLNKTKNILALQALLVQLKKTTERYANEIENLAENFHKEISKGTNEQDILVLYYQFISNHLLKTAQNQNVLGKNIQSEILDPFNMFVENFRQQNRNIATEGKNFLTSLEDKNAELDKTKESYWKQSKLAEKSGEQIEKTIQQMEQGLKTQLDLQKISDKSVQNKMIAQEIEQEYKLQVEICNEESQQFAGKFAELFVNFDRNDESRISFSKQTITNLTKQLMEFNELENSQNIIQKQKLTEYEEKYSKEQKISCEKLLLSEIPKGQIFKNIVPHKFISFDQKKEEIKKEQLKISDDYIIIGDYLEEKDKQKLDKVISEVVDEKQEFLSCFSANRKQSISSIQKISSEEEEQKKQEQQQSETIQQQQQNDNPIQYFQKIFKMKQARNYFLERLWNKMREGKQFDFLCYDDKFIELNEILKIILEQNNKENEFSPEQFYNILQISSRIIKKASPKKKISKESQLQRDFLCQKLNTENIFKDEKRWLQLYEFISTKKIQDKIKRHKILQQQQENNKGFIQGNVKKGFSIVTKGIGFGLQALGFNAVQQNEENNLKENEKNEINYLMLCDVNTLMLNVQLSSEFSSNLILSIANQKNIGNSQIQNLLEKQEGQKNNELRRFYYSYKRRKDKLEHKYKVFNNQNIKKSFIVKLCLKYLDYDDKPWNLMLVSRDFKKHLERKIFKMYLIRDLKNNKFLEKNRVKVYASWLKTDLFEINYNKLKQSMEEEGQKQQKQARIEEIIDLDVHRSLHIHKDNISKETLQNLLKTFAHQNKVISYCQGMNYIAGFLYLTIGDEEETYRQFHIIMNLYFQDLFTNQFKRLKIMFYQLSRCLSIFLPQLSEHFKLESIDPEYYATGWFITIFTSVFQYALKSHLLQVFWDIFIVEGFKGFFKCVLWLLKHHEKQFLQMQFDELLNALGEIIKSDLFKFSEQELKESKLIENVENIKQEIMEFDITTRFLLKLEKQYECFQLSIKDRIESQKKNSNQNNNSNNNNNNNEDEDN